MTELDEHGRPEPPVAADEVATLLGFLDWQRATLAWKCSGLEAAGLRATTAASMMTLGGILKHMALVEDAWFSRSLHGREYASPWDAVDWTADHDWEWRTAAEDSPEEQSFSRCGSGPWNSPAPMSRRCWTAAMGSAGWPSAPGPTGVLPACGGSCAT
jgi:Protein of unknown function (DUF664)